MPKLTFIIGYGASQVPILSKIVEEEAREHGFEGLVVSDTAAESRLDFIASSDAIVMYVHQLPDAVVDAVRKSKARLVASINPDYFVEVRGSPEFFAKAREFFIVGGERNLRNLVHLVLRELGLDVEVGEVEQVPWHGIYHPRYGLFQDVDEYLRVYKRVGEYTVGVLMYRSYWLYGNIKHVEKLIEALEGEGLNVIPVFTYFSSRDEVLGIPSAEDSIRKFFMSPDGKPLVDAVINAMFFFLLERGTWHKRADRFNIAKGVELLKRLGVPIITPVQSSSKSVKEWLEDPHGIGYMDIVYTVVMPEVDGLIEPIFFAGTKVDKMGVKVREPYEPHLRYLARRVKKWIELAKRPPSERRIAIVLINPPCKGLEAKVAVGKDLDVPESVVRLLYKLRELGYNVGDELPRDGKELMKMILSRKALSDFRWTSVKDIVKLGGALDFVDLNTYMEWFNELPSEVREKMIKDWGRPEKILSRDMGSFAGMVYEGKFVVPGLRFGNVVLTPQPKFGCAGPKCDGTVCKILHEPTITPPHQWLAVYRWLTRVFKADVLIHFGTHGYLEFRPGKGVGLSQSDWPEISIDDAPHLYVYAVTNPMEGVIAKRRSYAVIIDHMHPPMDVAEVFEELEKLVNDYWRLKQVGEFGQAKVVFDKIVELAKKAHITPKATDPEEFVDEVHDYLSMVKGTQINLGLHVFGHAPRETEKLARHAVTALLYDGAKTPSIVRAIAEYLGLDYDYMRSRPQEINKLGLTNAETLETLRKAAVEIVKRLIEAGASDEAAILRVADEVLKPLARGL